MFNQNKGPTMLPTNEKELREYSHSEVKNLLAMYREYQNLSMQINTNSPGTHSPRFSFVGQQGKMQNLDPLAELRKRREQLGEDMKFQNPLIWVLYKHLAYKDDPEKAIKSLGDLLSHCEVDGICHKRFDAINTYFRTKYGKDMTSSDFMERSMGLNDIAEDSRYISMCLSPEFQEYWNKNENNKRGKWSDYQMSTHAN